MIEPLMEELSDKTPAWGLRKAGRRVDNRWLFRDLTLAINPGDMVCLMGANGSGKSILLRSLCGLEPLEDGELLRRGQPVLDQEMPAFRREVLYVSQRPQLLGATLRQSLSEAMSFRVSADSPTDRDINSVLSSLRRPAEFADQEAEHMSGGELLLATLAQAMTLDPSVLLLDEPTAALDDATQQLVEERLVDWLEEDRHRALVWVTHDPQQAARLTPNLWRLADGQLQRSGARVGGEIL